MPPVKREQPNQRRKSRPSTRRRSGRETPGNHTTSLNLSSAIEDDLGTAIALAYSIELMGFGWGTFGDDYSKSLITVTRLLIDQLNQAKASCNALCERERKAREGNGAPQPAERA